MLILDNRTIGNRLLSIRKKLGLTQNELAEQAGLSNRTYADIERGTVNMKVETILRICSALRITPDAVLTEENTTNFLKRQELLDRLDTCTPKEQETALELLAVYLKSLD